MTLIEKLTETLSANENFTVNGKLLKNKVIEHGLKLDSELLSLIHSEEKLREFFFTEVGDMKVFDKDKFMKFVSNKQFLPDSYTTFKNKIGLATDNEYFYENSNVVVNFPYKECVLVGGQSQEDKKRNEIFWNTTLAPEQVDTLLEPKLLTNFKKYELNGINEVGEIQDTDNLIIKGNNLLALQSLVEKYEGRVKLIYIDPPYNTGSDGFGYNDKFNHSTWLTFMKNRLEIAKRLLDKEGSIFVHIDSNEQAYLKVLMDEIFPYYQSMITIQVKSPSGDSAKNKSLMEDTCEYILCYSKSKYMNHNNPQQIKEVINEDSNTVKQYKTLIKSHGEATEDFFEFEIGQGKEKEIIKAYRVKDFESETIPTGSRTQKYYKENIGSIGRTAAFSGAFKKAFKDKKDNVYVFKYTTTKGKMKGIEQTIHVVNGEQLIYLKDYSKEVKFEGKKQLVKMEKITNFVNDISWQGIAKEGGVILKNGKKPEELLRRIIDWTTEEGDLILDYHLGSGTTCAVAHKMGRQYIGIEQMDYIETLSAQRLLNVINGDKSGISKLVKWEGGGSFIYCELKELNKYYEKLIEESETKEALLETLNQILEKAALNYTVDKEKKEDMIAYINNSEIKEVKIFLHDLLDPNQLYLNYSEMDDQTYNISENDKRLNKSFYKEV